MSTERQAFLAALAADEDDTTTRLVFADWLDEHDEPEEADRMRKWPAAKAWLVDFAKGHTHWDNPGGEVTAADLIAAGAAFVDSGGLEMWYQHGSDSLQSYAFLSSNRREFWEAWSTVTGRACPEELRDDQVFRCGC